MPVVINQPFERCNFLVLWHISIYIKKAKLF